MREKMKKLLSGIRDMSPATKASIALMIAHFIQKGLSLITSPIYTRLLSTEEYGQVSLFFSWYEIFVIFTGLCLSKGVFNNGMMDFEDDRDRFTLSLYALTLISSTIVGSAICLFCKYVNNFVDIPLNLLGYMFVLLTFQGAYALWTVRNRFEYKYKASVAVSLTLSIISPLCGILGVLFFRDDKVMARIVCSRNVFLVAYFIILFLLIRRAKGKIKTAYWKYALKFNIPLIPHYLSLHILNHTDRIMVATLDSSAAAGIYSAAYNGAAVVKVFWQSINASLVPWTYARCKKKQFQELNNISKILITMYAILCIIFMFLAPEIMAILAPEKYKSGVYVIPSVVAGVFFSSIYYIFANVIYYYKKPRYVMWSSCISALLNLVLNWIFIPRFGFLAAGYTTLVSYLAQAIMDYFAMRKVIQDKIYDMKYFCGVSAFVLVISVVLNFVYTNYLIRYCLLAVLMTVFIRYLYRNWDSFLALLKSKKRK